VLSVSTDINERHDDTAAAAAAAGDDDKRDDDDDSDDVSQTTHTSPSSTHHSGRSLDRQLSLTLNMSVCKTHHSHMLTTVSMHTHVNSD